MPHPAAPIRRLPAPSQMLWLLGTVASVGVALFSYRYLPRMGLRSPEILSNLFARPFLDLHVAGAATALLVSPFQFLKGVRARTPKLHRWLGRVYVAGCLLGAVGGFVLAFGSFAGPLAGVGFGGLAIAWFFTTAQGWRTAMARRFVDHRAWMIRSAALTFAAVTLRLYLPLFPLLGVDFIDGYRAVSFLCWVPNLIVAELYLRGQLRVPTLRLASATA